MLQSHQTTAQLRERDAADHDIAFWIRLTVVRTERAPITPRIYVTRVEVISFPNFGRCAASRSDCSRSTDRDRTRTSADARNRSPCQSSATQCDRNLRQDRADHCGCCNASERTAYNPNHVDCFRSIDE